MRRKGLREAGGIVMVLTAGLLGACDGGAAGPRVAFVGGTLWDGSGGPPILDAVILVASGHIEAAGPPDAVRVPRGAEVVRLDGKWIIPGLIDAHAHADRWTLTRYLAYGVTSLRDLGGSNDSVFALRDEVGLGGLVGPRLFVSGAMIDRAPTGGRDATAVNTLEDARRAIDDRILRDASLAAVSSRIDQRLLTAMLDEAKTVGLRVTGRLGKVDAVTAARMGLASIEHLSGIAEAAVANPDPLFRAHDDPITAWKALGRAWADLDSARLHRVARALEQTGVAVVPTLALHESRAHFTDNAYIAGLDLSGMPATERTAWDLPGLVRRSGLLPEHFAAFRRGRPAQDRLVRLFKAAGGLIAAGSAAPNPLLPPGASLHQELSLLVRAGLTPREALLAATRDAARVIGVDSIGTIRPGTVADFVVLTASPIDDIANTRRIERIVYRGLARSPADLRAGWH